MHEMRKAYAISGIAFVIMAVVVIVLNFLITSSFMIEKASSDVSEIDRVYYETVDLQRAMFETRAANVFADALQDAAADALSVGVKAYTVTRPVEAIALESGDPENYQWFPSTPAISLLRLSYAASGYGSPVTSVELWIKPASSGEVRIWFEDGSNNLIGPDPAGSARVSGGVGQKVKVWVDDPESIDWSKVEKIRVQTVTDQEASSSFSFARTGSAGTNYVYTVYYKAGEESGHPGCNVGGVNKYGLTTGAGYYTTGTYGQKCLKFLGCEKIGLQPPETVSVQGTGGLQILPACSDPQSQDNCKVVSTSSSCEESFYPLCVEYTPVNCPEGSYYTEVEDENGNPVCSYTQGYQTEGCGIMDYQYNGQTSCTISPNPESPDNQPIGKHVLQEACSKMEWEVKNRISDHFSQFAKEVTAVIPEQVTVGYSSSKIDVQQIESTSTRCTFKITATIPFTVKSGTMSKTKTVQVQRILNISLLPPVKGQILYSTYDGYEDGNATCAVCHTDCNGFFYDSDGNPVLAENDPAFCCNARSHEDVQKSIDLCEQAKTEGRIPADTDCSAQGGTGNCLVKYLVTRHYYKVYREMREYAKIKVYDPDDPLLRVDFGDRSGDLFHIDTYVTVDRELAGVDESRKPKQCSDAVDRGPSDTVDNPITETYFVSGDACYDLSKREIPVLDTTKTLSAGPVGSVHSDDSGYHYNVFEIGYVEYQSTPGFVRSYSKFTLPSLDSINIPEDKLGVSRAVFHIPLDSYYTSPDVLEGDKIDVYRTSSAWNSYTDLSWDDPPFAEFAGVGTYSSSSDSIEVDVTKALRDELAEQKETGDDKVSLGIKFEHERKQAYLRSPTTETPWLTVTYAPVFEHKICGKNAQQGTVRKKEFDYWETLQSDAADSCRTDKIIVGTRADARTWKNRGLIKFDVTGMPHSDVTRAELVLRPEEETRRTGITQLYIEAHKGSMKAGSSAEDSTPTTSGQTYASCAYSWNNQQSNPEFLDDEPVKVDGEMTFDVTDYYLQQAEEGKSMWILLKIQDEGNYPGNVIMCQDTASTQNCNDRVFLRVYQGDKVTYYNVIDVYSEQPVCTDKKCYDTMKGRIGVYANNLTLPVYSKTISINDADAAYETVLSDDPDSYKTDYLLAGHRKGYWHNRALIQFNVNRLNIPEGATLKSAYLVLKPGTVSPDGSFVINAYRFEGDRKDISTDKYSWNNIPEENKWQKMGSADATEWSDGEEIVLDITSEVDVAREVGQPALVMLKGAEEDDASQEEKMIICKDYDPSIGYCDYSKSLSADWAEIRYSYYFEGEQKPDLTVEISKVEQHGDGTDVNSNSPGYFGEPLDVTLTITNQGAAEVPKGSSFSILLDLAGSTLSKTLTLNDPLDIGEAMTVTYTISAPVIDTASKQIPSVYPLSAEVDSGASIDELDESNNHAPGKGVSLKYRRLEVLSTGHYNAVKKTDLDTAETTYYCIAVGQHLLEYIEREGYSHDVRSFIQFNNTKLKNLLQAAKSDAASMVYADLSLYSLGFSTSVPGGDDITEVKLLSATRLRDTPLAYGSVFCDDLTSTDPEEVYSCTHDPGNEGDACYTMWGLFPELSAEFSMQEDYVGQQTVNITNIIQEAGDRYPMSDEKAALVLAMFLPAVPQELDTAKFYAEEDYRPTLMIYGYCPSGTCPEGLGEFA